MSRNRPGLAEPSELLTAAEQVARALSAAGVEHALIGAAAMAVYGYARSTADVDLATAVQPTPLLPQLQRALTDAGFDAEYNHPDQDDPLGGVIRVWVTEESTIDVVNFLNPARRGIEALLMDGLAKATVAGAGSSLRVIPLAHLIGLKLYSGDARSRADVGELLRLNPALAVSELRAFLARYRLDRELDATLASP